MLNCRDHRTKFLLTLISLLGHAAKQREVVDDSMQDDTHQQYPLVSDEKALSRARSVQERVKMIHDELNQKIEALTVKYYAKAYTLKKHRNQLLSKIWLTYKGDSVDHSVDESTDSFWSAVIQRHPEAYDLVGFVDEEHQNEWQALHDRHHELHMHDQNSPDSLPLHDPHMTKKVFTPQHLVLNHILDVDIKPLDTPGSYRYSIKLAPNEFIVNTVLWREEYFNNDGEIYEEDGKETKENYVHTMQFSTSGIQWKSEELSHHGRAGLFIHHPLKGSPSDGGQNISYLVFSPLLYFFEKQKSSYHHQLHQIPKDENHAFFFGKVLQDDESNARDQDHDDTPPTAKEAQLALESERNFDDRVASFLHELFEECFEIYDGTGRWDPKNPESVYTAYQESADGYPDDTKEHQVYGSDDEHLDEEF